MNRALGTRAVADALEEVQSYGDHMRSRVVSREIVHGDLIGVPKIEDRFLETNHGA